MLYNKLMSKKLKGKHSQIRDISFVMVTLISIALTIVLARTIYNSVDSGLSASEIATNESIAVFDNMEVSFSIFDSGFAFIVIGLIIALLISSFLIPSHPIFLIINIFGFLVLVFLGAVFSNLYADIILQPGINATGLTTTTFIATRLPWIGAILVFISTIIMFAKGRSEGI